MPLQSSRAKEIDAWMGNHQDHNTNERERVEVAGEIKSLEVWRCPLKFLVYNIRNGRFASELMAKERELKRKLDAIDAADAKMIRQLLLDQNPGETEALTQHIKLHGQLDPGVITFDGAVINANRRMAIISKLHDDTGEARFEYLNVARLPTSVTEKDLWRIEAGIQFARDFKLDYGPVNELLKLREGKGQHLTPKEISTALLGRYSEKQIEEKLEILKQIESYLEFIGKRQQYDQVQGDVEKFNSLVHNVLQPLKHRGASSRERADINIIAFSLIESGNDDITHWDIRKLRDIFGIVDARAELFRDYDPKAPRNVKAETLIESFQTALEIVEDKKAEQEPEKLLRRAIAAVKAINPRSPKLRTPGVTKLLKELEAETKQLAERSKQ